MNKKNEELIKYYENNKEKLRKLSKHGEPTIRAMALAIMKSAVEKKKG